MNSIAAATPDPEPDPTEEFYYDEPNEVESDPSIKWYEYLFGINGKQAS